MRFFAAGVIICSCSIMGFLAAASYRQRVNNLRQLLAFVQNLMTEINYTQTTLPDIIFRQISKSTGIIKEFLTILHTELNSGTGEHFAGIWDLGLAYLKMNGLPKSVIEDLRKTGYSLGSSDVIEQDKSLRLLIACLEQNLEIARAEQEKQTKLWQFLGFSTGVFMVLLLF